MIQTCALIQSWGQSILSHQFSLLSPVDDLHDAGFDDLHGAFSQAELLARLPAAGFVLCTLYAQVGSMILIYHLTSTVQYIFVHACIYCILACCDVVIKSTCSFFQEFFAGNQPLFNLWRQSEVYLCYLAYKGRQEIFVTGWSGSSAHQHKTPSKRHSWNRSSMFFLKFIINDVSCT